MAKREVIVTIVLSVEEDVTPQEVHNTVSGFETDDIGITVETIDIQDSAEEDEE